MAAMMSTTAATVIVAPHLSSGSAVAFNNGGFRTNMVVTRRSAARPLTVRAAVEDDRNLGEKIKDAVADVSSKVQEKMPEGKTAGETWTQVSSTGELNESKKKAAEQNNPDGTNLMDKLQDAGRTLKSKTNDVVQYGAKRNADTVDDNVTEKNIKEQSDYTKKL